MGATLLVGFSFVIGGVVLRAIGSLACRATVAHGERREENPKSGNEGKRYIRLNGKGDLKTLSASSRKTPKNKDLFQKSQYH
ncbi:unnamed protein product [Sphenostylis stenocarpa]|uniref:Secreted protein n=1 Tax=Sphenostylis stenocarpa TaxID=92480 RepID=A0AA86VZH6_9FABA|nr:unnamed protein product [Sphenostylis stenocarpa]